MPTCSRCKSAGVDCHYIKSKRGCRARKANTTPQTSFPQMPALSEEDLISDFNGGHAIISDLGLDDSTPDWLLEGFSFQMDEVKQSYAGNSLYIHILI